MEVLFLYFQLSIIHRMLSVMNYIGFVFGRVMISLATVDESVDLYVQVACGVHLIDFMQEYLTG